MPVYSVFEAFTAFHFVVRAYSITGEAYRAHKYEQENGGKREENSIRMCLYALRNGGSKLQGNGLVLYKALNGEI